MNETTRHATKNSSRRSKMKNLTSTFIAVVAMLALAIPLYAAGGDYDKKSEQAGATQLSVEKIKSMEVVTQTGEKIGEIKTVRTDTQTGEITFVTVSKGGVLGIGGEEIAVPFDALQFDQTNGQATLLVSESKLENAPQQANMSDAEFQRNLESHYGLAPAWEGESKQMEMDQEPMSPSQPGMEPTPKSD
jgi:sporulation protein YlmC with PRC-barrel domain